MKPDFLPEYSHMALLGQYAALYRFFTNQSWRHVCDPATKKPRLYSTVGQAIEAAKDHVRGKLNPDVRVAQTEPDDEDKAIGDVLGIEEWRAARQNERAESQIIRNRKSRSRVVVERKGEGRRNVGKKK